jgi:glycosyltransferase involved in cell wall biosynthesis
LFLIGSYGTGGKERQLAELLKGLPADKFEIHLFVKSANAHYLNDIKNKLTSYHSLERIRFGRTAFFDIRRHIEEVKPHIVHSWANMTSFYSVFARHFVYPKFILIDGGIRSAPSSELKMNFEFFQRKIINRLADAVVANSLAGLAAFKVPRSKSHYIYNGFDQDRINKLKDPDRLKEQLGINTRYMAGMVARFDNEKDWGTFFTAAETILDQRDDITFIAIGGGPDKLKYQEQLKTAHRGRMIFTGERDDVESIVNLFDIGLLTSYSEGISNSVIEYMALAKPVIASGKGGIPELILDGKTGFIFPVGDAAALINHMELLLEDASLRKSMGEEGRQRILEHFSFEKMVSSYEKLYNDLLCAE